MRDGTIVRWLKGTGDPIKRLDVLVEIETARSIVQVQADRDGTMGEILAGVGKTLPVGQPLAQIIESNESVTTGGKQVKETAMDNPKSDPEGVKVLPVVMPKAGNTMEEGTIIKWCVKEGDRVNEGDVIFEVETDKAAVEVEALDSGRLARIVAGEGDTVEVLLPIAYLAENDADVDAYLAAEGSSAGAAKDESAGAPPAEVQTSEPVAAPVAVKNTTTATSETGRIKASPAARKLAKQRGIDLDAIGAGSGPGGRIVSADVPTNAPAAPTPPAPIPPIPAGEPVRRKMSAMRKAIARNLLASKQNIPHFYIELTVDADEMMKFYRDQKAKYPCTVNDVIVLGCAKAMAEFPAFRSRIDGKEFVEYPTANIGIAVGMDDGLVVPVLKAAERLNLQQTGAETRRLAEAARKGKIEGMGQGLLTITNLGMFGIERFLAIINPPEAAILAAGAVHEDVIVSDGAMKVGQVMTLMLSCDHRVIDGLAAAKFLGRLKELLENPQLLA